MIGENLAGVAPRMLAGETKALPHERLRDGGGGVGTTAGSLLAVVNGHPLVIHDAPALDIRRMGGLRRRSKREAHRKARHDWYLAAVGHHNEAIIEEMLDIAAHHLWPRIQHTVALRQNDNAIDLEIVSVAVFVNQRNSSNANCFGIGFAVGSGDWHARLCIRDT